MEEPSDSAGGEEELRVNLPGADGGQETGGCSSHMAGASVSVGRCVCFTGLAGLGGAVITALWEC